MKLSLIMQQLFAVKASLDAASASISALMSTVEEDVRKSTPPPSVDAEGKCTHPVHRLLRIPTMGNPSRTLCMVCHEEFDLEGE